MLRSARWERLEARWVEGYVLGVVESKVDGEVDSEALQLWLQMVKDILDDAPREVECFTLLGLVG